MNEVNRDTIKQKLSLLNTVMSKYNLHNVDESGIPFDPKPPNVIAKKAYRRCDISPQVGRGK